MLKGLVFARKRPRHRYQVISTAMAEDILVFSGMEAVTVTHRVGKQARVHLPVPCSLCALLHLVQESLAVVVDGHDGANDGLRCGIEHGYSRPIVRAYHGRGGLE
jgi:hypothetical protein